MFVVIIVIVILILLYFIFKNNTMENMALINNNTNKCCVIKKVLNNNNSFNYNYSISDDCNGSFDNNSRTIKEGDIVDGKPFRLSECNANNFGSCRKIGFECVDFMTPNDCKKYNLNWNSNVCNILLNSPLQKLC